MVCLDPAFRALRVFGCACAHTSPVPFPALALSTRVIAALGAGLWLVVSYSCREHFSPEAHNFLSTAARRPDKDMFAQFRMSRTPLQARVATSGAAVLISRANFGFAAMLQGVMQRSCGIKTKSAAKKRFLRAANGRIKRWQANRRHINAEKSRKTIRRLGEKKDVVGFQKKYAKLLLGGK